ncbi:unnamed protein product [Arctogadus glacialis]
MRAPFCFPGVAALSGPCGRASCFQLASSSSCGSSPDGQPASCPNPGAGDLQFINASDAPSASERLGGAEEDGAERRSFGGATPPCAGPYSGRSEWRTHLESRRWEYGISIHPGNGAGVLLRETFRSLRNHLVQGLIAGINGAEPCPAQGEGSEVGKVHRVNRCCQCKASSRWAEKLSDPPPPDLNPSTSTSYAIAAHLTSSDSNTTTTKDISCLLDTTL